MKSDKSENRSWWNNIKEKKIESERADERLTDDDGVVVSDEHLAVDVNELCDEASLQLSVSPQASEGDVIHPMVVHWRGEEGKERK